MHGYNPADRGESQVPELIWNQKVGKRCGEGAICDSVLAIPNRFICRDRENYSELPKKRCSTRVSG
jgi:hypothetical protein